MKTRRYGTRVGSKLLASVLAGAIGVAQVAALAPMRVAYAQPAAPAPAPTDPKVTEARTHFNAGYAKYTANDYAGALTEFQAADALVPAGVTAQYIGLCQEKLGNLKEALASFDRFLANPGDKPQIIAAANALKPHVAQLRAQLTQKAQGPFNDGVKKYNAGDYAGALTSFQAADAAMSTPQTYKYLGQTYDHLGKLTDAVEAYQKFLANVPKGMEKDAGDVKARVDQIVATPGKVHVESTPAGATVFLDGQPQPTPTPADLQVPPGHHHLELRLAGHESKQLDIDVGFASQQNVPTQELPAEAPPPPPVAPQAPAAPVAATPAPAPPPQPRSKVPAYITGGLAVVAAGVGTVFGIMALNDKSNFDSNPTSGTADDGESHALIADMAFFVAVTLGVTSAVLFFTKDDAAPPAAAQAPNRSATAQATPKRRSSLSISAAPIVTPHGGGAGALIRF